MNYNANTTDSQDEQFIEVTENDEVIGPVARRECHNETRKPWHRSVHIYLFNEDGKVYFTQRSLSKDTAPGEWTVSAAGHVNFGQEYVDTAKTELKEELNIETELTQIDKLKVDYGTEREYIAIFTGITSQIPQINTQELQQIKAIELDQMIEDFTAGRFPLSGGSNHTFKHIIETGSLKDFEYKNFEK